MLVLNASGAGTEARLISSSQMWCWTGVQSRPPHSSGQFGTARPCALRTCWLRTMSSRPSSPNPEARSRMSAGNTVVKKLRISSRNAASSGVSVSLMVFFPREHAWSVQLVEGRLRQPGARRTRRSPAVLCLATRPMVAHGAVRASGRSSRPGVAPAGATASSRTTADLVSPNPHPLWTFRLRPGVRGRHADANEGPAASGAPSRVVLSDYTLWVVRSVAGSGAAKVTVPGVRRAWRRPRSPSSSITPAPMNATVANWAALAPNSLNP